MVDAVADRVRQAIAGYEPPSFGHVPNAEFALFLCAIDHKAGYEREHMVGGRGPFRGSELMWEAAVEAERHDPGAISARRLVAVSGEQLSALLDVDGDGVDGPGERAGLWREIAIGLVSGYDPRACAEGAQPVDHTTALLTAAGERLGGPGGLLDRLAAFGAYADPLQKKPMLFAKICERRGWFVVADPESWQVSADSVLMRVALRCGLVEPDDDVDALRERARDAWRAVAARAGIAVPVLDDFLWERGRIDPDLLGDEGARRHGAELAEPPRRAGELRY